MNHDNDPKQFHSDMNLSCPFYETDYKIGWKRERNRLAAKKSREKKALHMKFLEDKGRIIERQLDEIKELVLDYDSLLDKMLTFFETNAPYDPVLVFNLLYSMYRKDESFVRMVVIDKKLYVHNQRIERLLDRISQMLNRSMQDDR